MSDEQPSETGNDAVANMLADFCLPKIKSTQRLNTKVLYKYKDNIYDIYMYAISLQ